MSPLGASLSGPLGGILRATSEKFLSCPFLTFLGGGDAVASVDIVKIICCCVFFGRNDVGLGV